MGKISREDWVVIIKALLGRIPEQRLVKN